MPVYQYECRNRDCKTEFEERHTFEDYEKDQVCPKCGGPAERVLHYGKRWGPKPFDVEAPYLKINWISSEDGG
jgi:putative FmdB family regulatory protein